MAQHGSSSGKFDIKTPADKFFKFFIDNINKAYKTEENMIESVDLKKRTVTIGLHGMLISGSYEAFKATFTVTPMEDEANGSHVVWTVKFEKIRDDAKGPQWIIDILIDHVKETDANLNNI